LLEHTQHPAVASIFSTVLPIKAIITLDTPSHHLAEAGDARNFPH